MIRDMVQLIWALTIGIIEAIMQLFNNDIFLFVKGDGWKVQWCNRKKNE